MQRPLHPCPEVPALPGGFEAARLRHLLRLVGPEEAPALLAQLRLDLAGCAEGIARGAAGPDWDSLREASHVLISLAGSAGAVTLHEQAQALNVAAHARDPATLADLLPLLQADLAALIAVVDTTAAEAQE
ncbi:MAG: hypothetical protein ACK4P8_03525 [Tabrizicola sp.]